MEFYVDTTSIGNFTQFCLKQQKLVRRATGTLLNDFAFGTRAAALAQISLTMTVRNKRYIQGRVRVEKAILALPTAAQVAIVGSVLGPRFTGWVEQEYGTRRKLDRTATLLGRGGSESKTIRPSVRFKPGVDIVRSSSEGYRQKNGTRTTPAQMFAIARKKKENRLLFIKSSNYDATSVYKRKGKKFELVSVLDHKQPVRNRWMTKGRRDYFRKLDVAAKWTAICQRLMPVPPRL